jgi:ATP-dependent helicase/nuclease subunit B
MKALGGLFFRGPALTERDDLGPGKGVLGRPVWGRSALLADLELRLGLPTPAPAHGARLQQWSRRLGDVARRGPRFYSRSYEVDPIGTAATLLDWRDLLIDAGWDGDPIAEGGPRLQAFVELEAEGALPPGIPDRLQLVEAELAKTGVRCWEALELAEPSNVWPGRWQRVFELLERRGTRVQLATPSFDAMPATTDLGRVQAALRGETLESGFSGDGSLVLMTGETSWELGHAVASALRSWGESNAVVLRAGDPRPLAAAMAAQGLASQGIDSESACRPSLQVLSLALELAFSPRDPYRVLELVTLPLGPFSGLVGQKLARALSSSPGVGGRAWQEAKRAIGEHLEALALRHAVEGDVTARLSAAKHELAERLKQIAEWLEEPGHDTTAPRSALLAVSARVVSWLQRRCARCAIEKNAGTAGIHDEPMLRTALEQAREFKEALNQDPRDGLDLVAVRQLLDEVSLGSLSLALHVEEAGRFDVVEDPAGLRSSRELVVWWHCVNGTQETAAIDPWRRHERQALRAAGVALQDPSLVLAAEVEAWRRVVLAARKRLVLVIPSCAQGTRLDSHPLWDELLARVDAKAADIARVTLNVDELLAEESVLAARLPSILVTPLEPLSLPKARPSWDLTAALLGPADHYSATSLEDLLGCPLHWVLKHRAGLRAAWTLALPSGPRLNGTLGHRLVEELHLAGALARPDEAAKVVGGVLERLLIEEAAVLLRPGMTFELSQLRRQLLTGVQRLTALLNDSGLSVIGVEVKSSVEWDGRTLVGQLDLLLTDAEGREVVLDLKWGRSSYSKKLEQGLALQLAVYAGSRQLGNAGSNLPAAAFFALNCGQLLTTEPGPFKGAHKIAGPAIAETWKKLGRTAKVVERILSLGVVPVTGLAGSSSVLAAAGIPEADLEEHLEAKPPCEYCEHSALCGRAWESFS